MAAPAATCTAGATSSFFCYGLRRHALDVILVMVLSAVTVIVFVTAAITVVIIAFCAARRRR